MEHQLSVSVPHAPGQPAPHSTRFDSSVLHDMRSWSAAVCCGLGTTHRIASRFFGMGQEAQPAQAGSRAS
jgi:hypothetical protein